VPSLGFDRQRGDALDCTLPVKYEVPLLPTIALAAYLNNTDGAVGHIGVQVADEAAEVDGEQMVALLYT
jgi:hypothetical protein